MLMCLDTWLKLRDASYSKRIFSSSFIDNTNGFMYIIGGIGVSVYSDVWCFDLGTLGADGKLTDIIMYNLISLLIYICMI
jgi:hypothetical protein